MEDRAVQVLILRQAVRLEVMEHLFVTLGEVIRRQPEVLAGPGPRMAIPAVREQDTADIEEDGRDGGHRSRFLP